MRAIVLLSDGIDSPVAYYIMKRKMDCVAIHFLKNEGEKVKRIMGLLGGKIYFLPYEIIKNEILKVKKSYRCVICKRFMYRVAEKIADIERADIIVTGENLGQVASQTIENLTAIEEAITKPVVRPLIAMEKEEIINVAKKIGTYEISIKNQKKCEMAPDKPVTKAKIERVKEEEMKVDVEYVLNEVEKAKIENF